MSDKVELNQERSGMTIEEAVKYLRELGYKTTENHLWNMQTNSPYWGQQGAHKPETRRYVRKNLEWWVRNKANKPKKKN